MAKEIKVIRLSEVLNLVGFSKGLVYKKMKAGEFPKSISLGGQSVGWIESEIIEWVNARIAERDGGANHDDR